MMILVDVDRGQKRTRKTLFHVMFLKKGASAFRGSEVAQIDATALAAQTHMGRTMESDREATLSLAQGKGVLLKCHLRPCQGKIS